VGDNIRRGGREGGGERGERERDKNSTSLSGMV
jgi:hypothetical protein